MIEIISIHLQIKQYDTTHNQVLIFNDQLIVNKAKFKILFNDATFE